MTEADTVWWAHFWGEIEHWAFLGVVLALAIEFAALKFAAPYKEHLEKARELQIAQLTDRATRAELELMKVKSPRTLGPERQEFVAAAVAPFKGQRYKVAISQGADDAIGFWYSLHAALGQAGWIYVPAPPPSIGDPPAGVTLMAIPGVEIRIDPGRKDALEAAVLALANALHADGMVVAANINREDNPNEADRDIVLIVIGARVPRP
jgi:hypothetical protein